MQSGHCLFALCLCFPVGGWLPLRDPPGSKMVQMCWQREGGSPGKLSVHLTGSDRVIVGQWMYKWLVKPSPRLGWSWGGTHEQSWRRWELGNWGHFPGGQATGCQKAKAHGLLLLLEGSDGTPFGQVGGWTSLLLQGQCWHCESRDMARVRGRRIQALTWGPNTSPQRCAKEIPQFWSLDEEWGKARP